MSRRAKVVISPGGDVRFIYSDFMAQALAGLGEQTTRRASHVEPAPGGGWLADMSPVGGPVLCEKDGQPFKLRELALLAETVWLAEQHIPEPRP